VLAAVLATIVSALAGTSALPYPDPGLVSGATHVHDPSMLIRAEPGPRYVVYGTHNQTLTSTDRIGFARAGAYFPLPPSWWNSYSGGDVWAPDASFHGGRYWMYYAVSGHNWRAAIGVATSPSGLPGTWTDHGPVITSDASSNPAYHAIDPNLLVDADGSWWLTFGSYRTGIYMAALDPRTGKLAAGAALHHLAERDYTSPIDAVEAPFVFRHDRYYYLFTSWDRCCAGVASTYSIHVGRATCPTCPYVDESGKPLLEGGGTPLLASHGFVKGPGGQSVYSDNGADLLVYHYYDARARGTPTLGINFLGWDASGFPFAY
jgi:arabinan endo-1,5-alpha-L-arabinosidase